MINTSQIHIAPKIVHLTRCDRCKTYSIGICNCTFAAREETGFMALRPGESFDQPRVQLPLLSMPGEHAGNVDKEPA